MTNNGLRSTESVTQPIIFLSFLLIADPKRLSPGPGKLCAASCAFVRKHEVFCRWRHHAGSIEVPVFDDSPAGGTPVDDLPAAALANVSFSDWFVIYLIVPFGACSYEKMTHAFFSTFRLNRIKCYHNRMECAKSQVNIAKRIRADYIINRNTKDFAGGSILRLTTEELYAIRWSYT